MATGYVYVLSNVSMPGLVKIGRTDRTPEQRISELHTTGVPTPFEIELSVLVDDSTAVEKQIHALLSARGVRTSSNREFFYMQAMDAVATIKAITELHLSSSTARSSAPSLRTIFNLAKRPVMYKYMEYEDLIPYEERFKQIGEAGLPEAYLELSCFFIHIYPSTMKWRTYALAHLEELRKQTDGISRSLNIFEIQSSILQGKYAADYLIVAHDRGSLMDSDFEIISKFLYDGNRHSYEAYIDIVDRPTFPKSIQERALNL